MHVLIYFFYFSPLYETNVYIWNANERIYTFKIPIKDQSYWGHAPWQVLVVFIYIAEILLKKTMKKRMCVFIIIILTKVCCYCLYDQSTHKYDKDRKSVLDNCSSAQKNPIYPKNDSFIFKFSLISHIYHMMTEAHTR